MTSTRSNCPVRATRWVVVAVVLLTAAAAMAETPPIGRTYFIATIGLLGETGEPYELGVGCLQFTASEMCVVGGDCGTWQSETWSEPGPRQGGGSFTMQLSDSDTGLTVDIDGTVRIEARGRKSTIAGVAHAVEETIGLEVNFGFVGRHVPEARCLRLVEQYEERLVANP